METAIFDSRIKNGRERHFLTRIITKYLKKKDYSARRGDLTPHTTVANKGES